MMDILGGTEIWLAALFIFGIRVLEMTLDTLRVLFILRGRRTVAWFVGFGQSLLFVVAITSVLQNLDNPATIIGYAGGFATGVVVGMFIEERLAIGHTHMRIISSGRGSAIAEQLRGKGYAVTEVPARGRDGAVTLLSCNVMRRQVDWMMKTINEIDPAAFITAEEVRPVRRGFWRA
jgi:uncharacterized protein YebE (UPF0316 family)